MSAFFRNLSIATALFAVAHSVWADGAPPSEAVTTIIADANGALHLLPEHASINGKSIRLKNYDGTSYLGNWRDPADTVTWKIQVPNDGRYQVRIQTAAQNDGSVIIVRCAGKLALSVPVSHDLNTYKTSRVGHVALSAGRDITLTLKAVVDGWHPVHVRKVELIPMP
jgi:hypothetical protein